ncbi:uncharacterized protein V6R79_021030 [Siganus canaliculatus]
MPDVDTKCIPAALQNLDKCDKDHHIQMLRWRKMKVLVLFKKMTYIENVLTVHVLNLGVPSDIWLQFRKYRGEGGGERHRDGDAAVGVLVHEGAFSCVENHRIHLTFGRKPLHNAVYLSDPSL